MQGDKHFHVLHSWCRMGFSFAEAVMFRTASLREGEVLGCIAWQG